MKVHYKRGIPPTCFGEFMWLSSGKCFTQDRFNGILQKFLKHYTDIQHFISAHWFKTFIGSKDLICYTMSCGLELIKNNFFLGFGMKDRSFAES
jgi:hypothetical protein